MKRHIFTSSKLTITTAVATVLLATTLTGGTAFADPDKLDTQTTETQVITETEVIREAIDIPNAADMEGTIETAPAEDTEAAFSETVDLEPPVDGESGDIEVIEEQGERIIIREDITVKTETIDMPNVADTEDVIELPEAEETEVTFEEPAPEPEAVKAQAAEGDVAEGVIVMEEEKTVVLGTDENGEPFYPADALDDAPEPEVTEAAAETAEYACHVQPDGETECICNDDASCEALTNSETCQPHTEWRDSDLGGCTQKAG